MVLEVAPCNCLETACSFFARLRPRGDVARSPSMVPTREWQVAEALISGVLLFMQKVPCSPTRCYGGSFLIGLELHENL